MSDLITLHIELSGLWHPVLAMPMEQIQVLTLRPHKWLRFMGYCIYGARGRLQSSPQGISEVNPLETTTFSTDYYYVSGKPGRFIDIDAINDRISDSNLSSRSTQFRKEVVARDSKCIVIQSLNAIPPTLVPGTWPRISGIKDSSHAVRGLARN
ncbi:hypothetical protein R3P38DRAFT_3032118 [Favolaschia claudopus]|uniref:Uncharacterized protein n=1 Tax=Favolaschia claudopus TaxID=2862362 RepID=A0AAW0AFM5_9AGAR